MQPRLKTVKPLANYDLLLKFENGEKRVFNVSPWLDKGVFRALRDKTLFQKVKISFDTVEWPNGADLCPEVLYEKSRPIAMHNYSANRGHKILAVAEKRGYYKTRRTSRRGSRK